VTHGADNGSRAVSDARCAASVAIRALIQRLRHVSSLSANVVDRGLPRLAINQLVANENTELRRPRGI
jgi:hypothetical protein